MLEYDDEIERISNSVFSRGYTIGVAEGRIICKFNILKMLTKDYTDNQIRGLEPAEWDKATFIKFWNTSDRNNILDFYRKYENLSEKRLVNRYIAESEYLPWRSF